ncbi:hypothetical protein [Rhizobium sp.]|uniref:hypothetical protein n=1 Tax=Rhizobium sp. TaxID=391 RepID=UPI0034C6CE16
MRVIEQKGFSGGMFGTGFGVGDVRFQPDGNFVGTMYWHGGRGRTSIVGTLKGWQLSIDEVGPVGHNRLPFVSPCHIRVQIEPGTNQGRGSLAGCPVNEGRPRVTLTFKSPSPRDSAADAAADAAKKQKEEQAKADEAARPRHEAIFAVGAAQFVQDHCPALRVDFQQLTDVLKARGVGYKEAEASDEYKANLQNWNEMLQQKGAADTCYKFQASFAMLNQSRDMIGMIGRRE